MSEDKHERILVRVLGILDEIKEGPEKVYRNRNGMELEDLPGWFLLDGNENPIINSRDKRAPQIVELLPQIYYVPKPSDTRQNTGMGELMSARRKLLIKSIMLDSQLHNIIGLHNNPQTCYIEYRGMVSDMTAEGETQGQFRLEFAFAYILDVNRL